MDSSVRGRGRNKRFWSPQEDEILLQSLLELAHNPKWKGESGFKSGYMNKLEEMILAKLPGCGLKAEPHIESRLKHWSDKYYAMAEMLCTSGFGWDDEKKILQVERSVFDEWTKTHKKAKGLYGVPFPHYDMLVEIYGKDRATGEASESFVLADQNIGIEMTHEPEAVDSDDYFDVENEVESIQSVSGGSGASGSRRRKDFPSQPKSAKKHRILKKKRDEISDLASSFNSVSAEFGKMFQDMNAHLGAMAQVWGSEEERKKCEEERKKKLDSESDNILEEVMKLDILSPSDALEVATILMAEEHKLRVFYQAPTALKKQYVSDLLRKK